MNTADSPHHETKGHREFHPARNLGLHPAPSIPWKKGCSPYLISTLYSLSQGFKKGRKPSGSGATLGAKRTCLLEVGIENVSSSLICRTKSAQEQLCPRTCLLPPSLSPTAPSPLQNSTKLNPPSCPRKYFGKILLIWTIQDDLILKPAVLFETQFDASQLGKEVQK